MRKGNRGTNWPLIPVSWKENRHCCHQRVEVMKQLCSNSVSGFMMEADKFMEEIIQSRLRVSTDQTL